MRASARVRFVTVFRSVNIPGASHLMNFVVLTAALSGANAALYVSSRMLFSMARSGWAPAAPGKPERAGSPNLAVLVSSYGIVVALVLERWAPADAFVFILRAAFFGMILSWVVSLAAHVSFRRRTSAGTDSALAAAFPPGRLGIDDRLDRGLRRHSEGLVRLARQPRSAAFCTYLLLTHGVRST